MNGLIMGRLRQRDRAGSATPAKASRWRAAAARIALGLLAIAILSFVSGCSDDPDDSAPQVSGPTTSSDAPAFCNELLTAEVDAMARSLPIIGTGIDDTRASRAKTRSGAEALRQAANAFPRGLADAATATADAITAYLRRPAERRRFDAVIDTMGQLSKKANEECGL